MKTTKWNWLGIVSLTLATCSLVSTAKAQTGFQADVQHPLLAPLSPEDPRAQLDPHFVNIPAKPQPTGRERHGTVSRALAEQEVTFDMMTGRTTIERPRAFTTQMSSTGFADGHPGMNFTIDSEPVKGRYQIQKVFGADDRVQILSTHQYPWRTQCKLYMRFPSGNWYSGSATMVGYKYALTAGHCVYDASEGGWANYIQVVPGLDGTYMPYGAAYAVKLRSYKGWTQYGKYDHDFALITLDRNIGNTVGWLGYGYWSSLGGVTTHIAGYPGDKGGITLWYDSDPVQTTTSKRVYYWTDTNKGQSGSGVYRIIDGNRYVFAVHSGYNTHWFTEYNRGTRIDSTKFNSIKSWIASGQ